MLLVHGRTRAIDPSNGVSQIFQTYPGDRDVASVFSQARGGGRAGALSKEFLSFSSIDQTSSFHVRFAQRGGGKPLTKGPLAVAPTVLLVEDEQELANEIKAELEGCGYLVRRASIADAAEVARRDGAALLILDRLVCGVDSLKTLELLRKQGVKIPVLMISGSSSVDEIADGLRAGADDYLAKPFYIVELVARIGAMLRRLGDISTTRLKVGDLEIDLLEQSAFKAGARLNLLPREFKLLEYFLRRPGQVVTRAMLLKDVWQYEFEVETNVVDTHISNLRKKIDEHGFPSRIANVRRLGYMLRAQAI